MPIYWSCWNKQPCSVLLKALDIIALSCLRVTWFYFVHRMSVCHSFVILLIWKYAKFCSGPYYFDASRIKWLFAGLNCWPFIGRSITKNWLIFCLVFMCQSILKISDYIFLFVGHFVSGCYISGAIFQIWNAHSIIIRIMALFVLIRFAFDMAIAGYFVKLRIPSACLAIFRHKFWPSFSFLSIEVWL